MITSIPPHEVTAPSRSTRLGSRRSAIGGLARPLLLGVLLAISALGAAEHEVKPAPQAQAQAVEARTQAAGRTEPASHGKHDGHEEEADEKGHQGHGEHEDGDAHEHEEAEHAEAGDAHAGDRTDSGHDDHGHGDEEHAGEGLTLSADEKRNAGIAIATAGPGTLTTEIRLPGEVSLNRDRVVHVVPQLSGVAREISVSEGDTVEAGQVLAVLDSSELGEAKLAYLTKSNEILCCEILLPRAKAVHDNTLKLLSFLAGNPSLGELQQFDAGEVGENLTTLVGAYAELAQARQAFEREQGLHQKEIASGQEYFAAKTALEKAAAEYRAARDSIAFETKRELLEAEAKLREAKFAARTAEQRLRIMGIADAEIHELDRLILPEEECTDPNCRGCQPGTSAKDREHYFGNGFTKYEIRAPIAGRIVERHLSGGEKVGDDTDIFTIADTHTVWVELTVYLKDLHALSVGDEVVIQAQHSGATTRGRIAVLSPTVDTATRTATARVVIENEGGAWRPGVFVVGLARLSAERLPVVVPKHAVQTVAGRQVVFVPHGEVFEPLPVQTGRADRERVEIVAGLAAGTPFVSEGAFELKAKLVTSSLGSHAGHGH